MVQVAISFTHTCAVLDTGGVRCWGYANLGELGYGNIANNIGDNETPASVGDVPLGGPAAMVAVGRWHSCALMAAGGVRCWVTRCRASWATATSRTSGTTKRRPRRAT